jgi:hypothetical protein
MELYSNGWNISSMQCGYNVALRILSAKGLIGYKGLLGISVWN